MKNAALVFIALIAGTFASPALPTLFEDLQQASQNERIVVGQIIEALENLSQQIRDAGLDPLKVTQQTVYELPVPVLFSANIIIDNLLFTGLSNIVVQSMNFSILQSRLTFNIVLPSLRLNVRNSEANIVLFGEDYYGSFRGILNINTIRLVGDVRVNIGIVSGISIRNLSLNFSLGGIESALRVNLFGKDLSERINTSLGTTIPGKLSRFEREINQLLEIVVKDLINDALNFSFF